MGAAYYLINENKLFVILVSFVAGFVSCVLFMVIWEMMVNKMNFKGALEHSYRMSIITIVIMVLTENLIILFIAPQFASHQRGLGSTHMNSNHDFRTMVIAMSLGFLFSLPYNYYNLQKRGETCHVL